ncbi:MAG: four helix bundle protein [Rhodothermia bacterium]
MPDQNLKERFTDFGIDVTLFARTLPNDDAGRCIKGQLTRSAMSVGANYREAQSARSKKEFTSKVQIALGEANESQHWLETVIGILPLHAEKAEELLAEGREITAILTVTVQTAKSRPTYRGSTNI